jgi:hypothetical protein
MALILLVLGGGFFLFLILQEKLFDRLFPTGIRPAQNPRPEAPKPLVRVLSLPLGLIVGVVLAVLGLDRALLNLFS